jgi:hypothetical protein
MRCRNSLFFYCLLVASWLLIYPSVALSMPIGKILLLEIDLGAAGSYDGITLTYDSFVDDSQQKFYSEFNCRMDYEKGLDSNVIEELKFDFYKLKIDFYNRREGRLSTYNFDSYDYIVGSEIVSYSQLGLIVYDVVNGKIIKKTV